MSSSSTTPAAERSNPPHGLHPYVENFHTLSDDVILRLPVICAVVGVSPATVWRMPAIRPLKITAKTSGRRVGDIRAYLASRQSKAD